ncbi:MULTISPECIES: DUF2848 family protein [Rummeliibacillus]|uniref:DUF2848 family protein n=1 Tax=Rummeliibacillus TaxID=648802 RepID=UPI0011B569CB|nr:MULTISPECIES: DUF2848 family protein [Rummeliibacillus]
MEIKINNKTIDWIPNKLLIAGFTGRNQEEIKAHIQELKEIGIPEPDEVPAIYHLSPSLLTTKSEIFAINQESSGEIEYILLHIGDEWYVGLGSDHTDRELEKVSFAKSKQVCAKPISKEYWNLSSVSEIWDTLKIKSWVTIDGKEEIYQEGTLENLLHPTDLLNILTNRGYDLENTVLFCGTLPIINGDFIYGDRFRAEIINPQTKEKIHLDYHITFSKTQK